MEIVRRKLNSSFLGNENDCIKWLKEIPLKASCFIQRAKIGIIPTVEALDRRGINISPLNCSYYRQEAGSADHVLIGCPFYKQYKEGYFKMVWSYINNDL